MEAGAASAAAGMAGASAVAAELELAAASVGGGGGASAAKDNCMLAGIAVAVAGPSSAAKARSVRWPRPIEASKIFTPEIFTVFTASSNSALEAGLQGASSTPVRSRRPNMRRFAMHRHPIERAVSAYYSKVACGHGDKEDHAGVVAQLIKHAPKAATRLGPKSDPHGAVPCLASLDWARLLAEAAESSVAERRLINAHFLPQSDACAFDELGYDVLVPIADNEAGLAALAQHLGFPPATLGHKHSTTATRKRLPPSASSAPSSAFELDSDTLTVLRRIYAHDLKLLRYATV